MVFLTFFIRNRFRLYRFGYSKAPLGEICRNRPGMFPLKYRSMNNLADLKKRLLRLYPVAALKSHFQPTNKLHADIIDELAARSEAEINQFAFANFDLTRQHISVYSHAKSLTSISNIDFLDQAFLISRHALPGKFVCSYLYKHVYDVFGTKPNGDFEKLTIHFKQPIQLIFEPGTLKICFTILERNPSMYLPGYEVFKYKKKVEDIELLTAMHFAFLAAANQSLTPINVNKGVKALWENDTIDARSVRFKGSHSTVSEVMDEEFTFKKKYPQKYDEVINSPLRKHVFRFLVDTEKYGDFECDPSEGVFSFNKYPKEATTVNDVVSKILAGNV